MAAPHRASRPSTGRHRDPADRGAPVGAAVFDVGQGIEVGDVVRAVLSFEVPRTP